MKNVLHLNTINDCNLVSVWHFIVPNIIITLKRSSVMSTTDCTVCGPLLPFHTN